MGVNIYSTLYDDDFEQMRGKLLKWYPWVGSDYSTLPAEYKILIVGESHYQSEAANGDNFVLKVNCTRRIIGSLAVDANISHSNFYKNTFHLINGFYAADKQKRVEFWKKVCFYNFIQRPMANSKDRPTIADWSVAGKNFIEVLTLLQPSVCIFLGLSASDHVNHSLINSTYKFEKPITKIKPIGKNHPRIGRITGSEGRQIKLLFVKHPSSYFNVVLWNAFLNKNAPSQMSWLKTSM